MNKQISSLKSLWLRMVTLLLILSSLLASCRFPWQRTVDVASEEMAQIEETPTPEPRDDLPPALVEITPLPNSVIGLQQPISLFFNQPMNTASVEAAVNFSPSISGRFTWEDDRVLTFSPDQALLAGSRLHLEVDTTAQASNLINLQQAVAVDFTASEYLEVLQVVPERNSRDVDPEGVIFVVFNQPVVPLGGETEAEPAFTLSPGVEGSGMWLNTSTYTFSPDPSLNGGTRYTINLDPSLVSTFGSGFDSSSQRQFSFTTSEPQVVNILPQQGEKLSLDGPVEIHFNIRMDAESVANHFELIDQEGFPVPGELTWDEGFQIAVYTPDDLLDRNAAYTIRIAEGAESIGGLAIASSVETSRTTYPELVLDASSLPDFYSYYGGYGQYQMTFTAPLDEATFREAVQVDPALPSLSIYLNNGTNLFLSGYFDPETTYTITLKDDLQDQWGGVLGSEQISTFFTPPAAANLTLAGQSYDNLAFVPADASEITLQATNINTVYFELSPISEDDLMALLHPDNYDYRQAFVPDLLEFSTHDLNLTRNVNQVVRLPLVYGGEPLSPGIYYLAVSTPDIDQDDYQHYQKFYLIVSENNLVMKIAPEEAFVWATRLEDFKPLSDARISIYTTEGDLVANGRTDLEGIFNSEIAIESTYYNNFFAITGEPGQADFAFAISTWNQDYALYDAGIPLNTVPQTLEAYIYTDRPIYRPGDEVNFKVDVFSRENGLPIPPAVTQVTLIVTGDPGMSGVSNQLYQETLTLNGFGTIEDGFTLPDSATTGLYSITVTHDEILIGSLLFDVAAYRKPQIEIEMDLGVEENLVDEALIAEAKATTYFGMPVSGQSYSWTLFSDETRFDLPGYIVGPQSSSWLLPSFRTGSLFGSFVSSGDGRTDENGYLEVNLTGDQLVEDDFVSGATRKLTLELSVPEDSGFTVSNRKALVVHPEEFYIGVQPEAYFGSAEMPFSFSILTVGWDRQAVGNILIEADFEAIEWQYEKVGDPGRPYQLVPITSPIASASPITSENGKARVTFTPSDPGTYQLTLRSGNAVTQVIIWVGGTGTPVWPRQTQNQVQLTADAENYQPGQIAQIFLPNPFVEDVKALVTVERVAIMESQVLEIEGSGTMIPISISEESIPNIYVSVVLLGKNSDGLPDYRQGTINLAVPPLKKLLNVDLQVDPPTAAPGEMVTATLTVSDQRGNPVQGEFSVAVVDKAVLALVDPNSQAIVDAFYGEQPLSVQTSTSLKTYAISLLLSELADGLGGGGDGLEAATVREEFPDTAFWRAEVVTASDGTARIEFPLPDSLTTWVISVKGLTEDYLVGEAEAEIVTQKALMIQPLTPRFLVDGDQVELAAVIYNNTSQTRSVDVSLQSVGFSMESSTSQNQTITIEANDSAKVTWLGTVESVELVDLVFQANSGDLHDASTPLWGDLEVKRYAMPYTTSTAGQLIESGQKLELISLPVSTDPESGDLSIVLNPSLTSTLVESIEAMETLPYDDTLTVLSRLLANLNGYLALRDLGIESPQLQENLETQVAESVVQLLATQNFDGGWSWWAGSRYGSSTSDPFITAYVLMGLKQASVEGIQVNEMFLIQAEDFLSPYLVSTERISDGWMLDRLAFLVYVLGEGDRGIYPAINGLFNRRTELSPWAQGLLSLAIYKQNSNDERVQTILNDLEASAIRSATGVYWQTINQSWLLPGTPSFNTAVVLFALSQLDPASTSISPALQYLMTNRSSDNFGGTAIESAWMLMGITSALKGTGAYQADFDYQTTLNDVVVIEGVAEGTAPLTAVKTSIEMNALYPDSPNALIIERGTGTGTLYYRVDLKTYQRVDTAQAINKGISIERQYFLIGEQNCPSNPECEPIQALELSPGDPSQLITVSLTLTIASDMVNFMLEDFIPAGTEIVNRQFLTTQSLPEGSDPIYNPRAPFDEGWGWWYFNSPQIYDDHILWTAAFLPAGMYTLTYELLPFQRGTFQVLPAHAWLYYYPEVMGTSTGDLFTIE